MAIVHTHQGTFTIPIIEETAQAETKYSSSMVYPKIVAQSYHILGPLDGKKGTTGTLNFSGTIVNKYVDLSDMEIIGSLILDQMQIENYFALSKATICLGIQATELQVSGSAHLDKLLVGGNSVFYGTSFAEDVECQKMSLNRLYLSSKKPLEIRGCLDLSDARINHVIIDNSNGSLNSSQAPLVIGSYRLNTGTQIPNNLRSILEKYQRVE